MIKQIIQPKPSRRTFIASILTLPLAAKSLAKTNHRSLSLYHTHTEENLSVDYHDGHSFITPALEEINHFLSDLNLLLLYLLQ